MSNDQKPKIVNLRQARKQKKRAQENKTAEDNRRKFGKTKIENETFAKLHQKDIATHEGNKLTDD